MRTAAATGSATSSYVDIPAFLDRLFQDRLARVAPVRRVRDPHLSRCRLSLFPAGLGVDAAQHCGGELAHRDDAVAQEELALAEHPLWGGLVAFRGEHRLVLSGSPDEDLAVEGQEDGRGQARTTIRLDVDRGHVAVYGHRRHGVARPEVDPEIPGIHAFCLSVI